MLSLKIYCSYVLNLRIHKFALNSKQENNTETPPITFFNHSHLRYFWYLILENISLPCHLSPTQKVYQVLQQTWAQKAGRLDRLLDHGPNPPLFGLLPLSDDRPLAPLATTHHQDAMCVAAWSKSPNEASIGTLSRGGWFVTLAWLLDHGPNPPFFDLMLSSNGHAMV